MTHWKPRTLSASVLVPTRPGARRDPLLEMLALEYLLTPTPRPHGLQKQLAHCNGRTPGELCRTIRAICGLKRREKRA